MRAAHTLTLGFGVSFRAAMAGGLLLFQGCSAVTALDVTGRPVRLPAPSAAGVARSLAGATVDFEPETIYAPPLERWPRYLQGGGPVYALFEVHPYVGQLGAVGDADRADAGSGFGVVLGYRTLSGGERVLGYEFVFESSGHRNASSGVDARALRVGGAVRASFSADRKTQPFAVAGGGFYMLNFDDLDPVFDISGPGFFLGGGVDFARSRRFTARAEACLHIWSAADGTGNGGLSETLTIGFGAATSF